MMYRLKIVFFIGLVLITPIFSESLSFDMTDEVKDVNEKIEYESSKISHRQQKVIGKFLGLDKPIEYTIENGSSWCYSIKDEDSKKGCIVGIYLTKGNISSAEGWCYSIKDEDSKKGCIAGIYLAKGNISSAEGWCHSIEDEDSKIKQAENSDNNVNYEVNQLEEEITQTKNELASDKTEALETIRELEECEECLEDPEIKALYLQLKGDL